MLTLTHSLSCLRWLLPARFPHAEKRSVRRLSFSSAICGCFRGVVGSYFKIACHSQRCEASIFSATQAANHRDASSARSLEKAMPSLTGGRVRPSLRHARSTGEWRGSAKTRIKFFCCCFPIRESRPTSAAAAAEHAQKDSLLEKYGIDELSDTDGESELPENPMSPEQIARMRTCSSQQHGISSPADITR
jgi:hypothetical protein